MSCSASFPCDCNTQIEGEFAALPATHQCSAVADRRLDFVDSHAAGELVEKLLGCGSIKVRKVVPNAPPLRWRESFWKAKITITTTTTIVTICTTLETSTSLSPWLWFWVK